MRPDFRAVVTPWLRACRRSVRPEQPLRLAEEVRENVRWHAQDLGLHARHADHVEIAVALGDPVRLHDLIAAAELDEAILRRDTSVLAILHLDGNLIGRALDDDVDLLLGLRI